MKPWARWTVRILRVSCGLLLVISSVAGVLEAASALDVTTDEDARRTLLLAVAGVAQRRFSPTKGIGWASAILVRTGFLAGG